MMSKENIPEREKDGILKIGIDLDGTLVETDIWFLRLIRRGLKIRITREQNTMYDLEYLVNIQNLPNGERFVKEVLRKPFAYRVAKPLSGAIQVVNRWRAEGHKIWFITARPPATLEGVTLNWFEEHGLDWAKDKVFFYHHRTGESHASFKAQVAGELALNVLIDDHAETVRKVSSRAMLAKLVFQYPWNVSENIGDARFVKSWDEIDRIVRDLVKTSHNVDGSTALTTSTS